jgi:hypothetical protein
MDNLILFWNKWLDEDKDRVQFYMSMSTTMQIAVGGKSVGFIDREGSSPSIPTQVRSRTD